MTCEQLLPDQKHCQYASSTLLQRSDCLYELRTRYVDNKSVRDRTYFNQQKVGLDQIHIEAYHICNAYYAFISFYCDVHYNENAISYIARFRDVVVRRCLDEAQDLWRYFITTYQRFHIASIFHCERTFCRDEKETYYVYKRNKFVYMDSPIGGKFNVGDTTFIPKRYCFLYRWWHRFRTFARIVQLLNLWRENIGYPSYT